MTSEWRRRVAVGAAVVALSWMTAAAAGAAAVRWEEGSGLTEPRVVEKAPPQYPEEARKEKVQGAVVLEATIETDGKVSETTVVEDPDARLTAAAREAVAKWRFEPARDAKGKPVAVRYRVTVAFKLQ